MKDAAKTKTHPPKVIARRRELVAEMRSRKMGLREIVTVLGNKGRDIDGQFVPNPSYFPDPATGKPWDTATIRDDIASMKKRRRRAPSNDTEKRRAMLQAELVEVRRQCWEEGDLEGALKSITDEARLFGIGGFAAHPLTDAEREAISGRTRRKT